MDKRSILFKKHAFTLIELLVVLVIIGVLATLTTIALGGIRAKARDSRRISDIKQMQTALELYYSDAGNYPVTTSLQPGQTLTLNSTTYMKVVPNNPTPSTEGACAAFGNYNYYQVNGGVSYAIDYCLAQAVNDVSAGRHTAIPNNMGNAGPAACANNCGTKACGTDTCGNVCGSVCGGSTPVCKSDFTACVGCNTTADCLNGKTCNGSNVCVCAGTPTVPTGVTLVGISGGVAISWSAVAGVSGYNIYRTGYSTATISVAAPTVTSTDTGLVDGQTYNYEVASVACGDEGAKTALKSKVAGSDFAAICGINSSLGDTCSGGYLICKPSSTGDTSCGAGNTYYVVVAPGQIPWSSQPGAVTACTAYRNPSAPSYTDWTLPLLSGLNSEICRMAMRSNLCASLTSAPCNMGCTWPSLFVQTGLQSYWSSTSNVQSSGGGQWGSGAGDGSSRCVRRF